MNTLETISKRKSTRAYNSLRVSEEDIESILKAAFAAPIAMAKYETLYITVIENEDFIDRINAMTQQMFYEKLGVKKSTDFGAKTMILVSSSDGGLAPEMRYANVGIVVENMILAATSLGIDSVILGGAPAVIAKDGELVKALGIPDGFTPVLGAYLGYSEIEEPPKKHTIAVNRVK